MAQDDGRSSDFHLSEAERERLHPGIDVDALEHLLAALPADAREIVLDAFDANPRYRAFEESLPSVSLTGGLDGRPMIPGSLDLFFADPMLQQLLEPVNASLRSARAAEARRREQPEWYQRVERPAREAPVRLVIPPEWDDEGAAAIVVRRPDASPPDLILIDAGRVDADVLDSALAALLAERRSFGLIPRRARTIPIGTARVMGPSTAVEARLRDALRRLVEAPACLIDGIGLSRALEFRIDE